MNVLDIVMAAMAECNLHLSLYGALGTYLFYRGALALKDGAVYYAREHMAHGLIYCALGMI